MRNTAPIVLFRLAQWVKGLTPLVLGLAVWQTFGPARSPYFPPPSSWVQAATSLFASGRLLPALEATVESFLLGILVASLSGLTLGLLVGRSRPIRRAFSPLFEFCRGLPPPLLVPLAVLMFGYAESLKLLVIVWVSMWPLLLNTASGASNVDPLLFDLSKTLHLSRFNAIKKVLIPAVAPSFLLGLRVAVPLAVIMTLLVEMLTSLPGVGSLIVTSQRQFRSAEVYALLFMVGILGLCFNAIFSAAQHAVLRRWPPTVLA
jgi:ABC-type nitrate/sulfonate/bicarbonate transport system permease component